MTIIYNKANGRIIVMTADTIDEVASIVYDIPEGYTVSSINIETKEPILKAIPKTTNQKEIDNLKIATRAFASASTTLTDEQVLSMPEFFPEWLPNTKYVYGQIVNHNEQLYRIKQQEIVSNESQPPEMEGMLAVYSPINQIHKGTLEDPIPWIYGMDCYAGKYYTYNNEIYKCNGDMIPCIWEPGSIGVYQWELVSE